MGDPVFDLDRYLERIGLSYAPSPDLDGLEAVQAAQLRAVPFENLDVLLTGQIDVEPDAIFDKLVRRGRGGYCFECNLLLREALLALGFEARTLLARVVIDRVDGPVPARTHAIVEVQIGDRHYAADCGFGAQTPRGVLQLPDGTTRDGDAAWRLQDDPQFGVRLLKEDPDRPPHDLYVFDFIEVHPADIALGNHWTSTHPSSHFTQKIVAVRQNDGGRVAIDGRTLVERRVDGEEVRRRPIAGADDLVRVIRDELGIQLEMTAEQGERLWVATEPPSESRPPVQQASVRPEGATGALK